jgi:hypothetical protein
MVLSSSHAGAGEDSLAGTSEAVIAVKKFVHWHFSITGISGAIIAITGTSWLFYFSPLARIHHLNMPGYLILAFFMVVLVFSGWVFPAMSIQGGPISHMLNRGRSDAHWGWQPGRVGCLGKI